MSANNIIGYIGTTSFFGSKVKIEKVRESKIEKVRENSVCGQ